MIIQNLTADNLLKYRRLELTNLPPNGIIAISGYNESGKSSIGEAICFALFGRTFAIGPNEIHKLIRWGENHCSVTLGMRLANGIRYQLYRSIDREHNHSARISRADDPTHPIARGKAAIEELIKELLGYDFEAFVDSFYLAQREITAPHPQGHAIHVMAGIAPLAACNKELQEDIKRDQITLEELARRSTELKIQLTELDFDSQRTHILTADQTDLASREHDFQIHQQALTETVTEYKERKTRQQWDTMRVITFSRLSLLTIIMAVVCLGIWATLMIGKSYPIITQLLALMEQWIPSSWLLYGGVACFILSAAAWVRIIILQGREKNLYASGVRVIEALAAIDKLEISIPKSLRPRSIQAPNIVNVRKARLDPESRIRLRSQLPQGQISVISIEDTLDTENAWLEQMQAHLAQRKIDLHQEIQRERERRQACDRLTNTIATLKKEEADTQHSILLRVQAEEILQGAMRHLTLRFNHHLRGLAGRTLPMFTDNRYQHLQIDTDLTVRAFSNEKRDFMELDEVSSGTQRQIMLAIRLSLTQQLIDRVVRGSQFIFLDEPFAFFDEARTRSTLMALPKLSNDITQVWVVAQQFPNDFPLERVIICQRERDEYCSTNGSHAQAMEQT